MLLLTIGTHAYTDSEFAEFKTTCMPVSGIPDLCREMAALKSQISVVWVFLQDLFKPTQLSNAPLPPGASELLNLLRAAFERIIAFQQNDFCLELNQSTPGRSGLVPCDYLLALDPNLVLAITQHLKLLYSEVKSCRDSPSSESVRERQILTLTTGGKLKMLIDAMKYVEHTLLRPRTNGLA